MLGRNHEAVYLSQETLEHLDSLVVQCHRDREWILEEAIRMYADLQNWQIQHIQAGIRQADQGLFATNEEMG